MKRITLTFLVVLAFFVQPARAVLPTTDYMNGLLSTVTNADGITAQLTNSPAFQQLLSNLLVQALSQMPTNVQDLSSLQDTVAQMQSSLMDVQAQASSNSATLAALNINPTNFDGTIMLVTNAVTFTHPVTMGGGLTVQGQAGQTNILGATIFTNGVYAYAPLQVISNIPPAGIVVSPSVASSYVLTGQTASVTFTVSNSGGQQLAGTATVPSPFSIVSGAPYFIGGGSSGNVVVSWPGSATATTNTATVTFTGAGGATSTVIAGATNSIPLNPAVWAVTPSSATIAGIVSQTISTNFTVQNTAGAGSSNLVGSASISSPFSIASGASYNIVPGGSANVVINYNSSVEATNTGTLTFHDNGGGTTASITAYETNGVIPAAISVTPSSFAFGSVLTNTVTNTTFVVQNTGGGTLSGSASVSSPFNIYSGGSYSLTAGQSQNVVVQFTTATAGSYTNTVAFTGAAGASATVTATATNIPAATPHLIAYWPLEAATGSPKVNSVTGVADMLDARGTSTVRTNGFNGYGAYFAGNTTLLTNNTIHTAGGSFTVSCWFYPTSFARTMTMVAKANGGNASVSEWALGTETTGAVRWSVYSGGAGQLINDNTHLLVLNSWNHLVATYDASAMTISVAVNGNTPVSAATTKVATNSGTPVSLGNKADFNVNTYVSGVIDEVGIWNRAFNLTEMGQLYNSGAGQFYPFPTNLQ